MKNNDKPELGTLIDCSCVSSPSCNKPDTTFIEGRNATVTLPSTSDDEF